MRRSDLLFGPNRVLVHEFAMLLHLLGIDYEADLATIDAELQARFFSKKPDGLAAERWELPNLELPPMEVLKPLLRACGFWNAIIPSGKVYDYAAWPGALVSRAGTRLMDLISAWNSGVRWNQLITFGGKRPRMEDKEGFEAFKPFVKLEDPGLSYNQHDLERHWNGVRVTPQTELENMQWMWQFANIPGSMSQAGICWIDAPMKDVKGKQIRPNTEDTIHAWLEVHNPKPGKLLLSSGAPYGMAQDGVFRKVLEPLGFEVETFGHAMPEGLSAEAIMREVAGTVHAIFLSRK